MILRACKLDASSQENAALYRRSFAEKFTVLINVCIFEFVDSFSEGINENVIVSTLVKVLQHCNRIILVFLEW